MENPQKKEAPPRGDHKKVIEKKSSIIDDFNNVLIKHGIQNLQFSNFQLRENTLDVNGCHQVCEHLPTGGFVCWMECE